MQHTADCLSVSAIVRLVFPLNWSVQSSSLGVGFMSFITILLVVTTTVIMVVPVIAFRSAIVNHSRCRRPSSSWLVARYDVNVNAENALGKNDISSTIQIKRNISMVIQSLLGEGRLNDAVSELLSWERTRRRRDDDDDDDDGHNEEEIPASIYHAILEACCKEPKQRRQKVNNQYDDDNSNMILAEKVLQSMKEMSIVTTHAHETLISGYARRSGQWEDALRTLEDMETFLASSSSSDSKISGIAGVVNNASKNVYRRVLVSLTKSHQYNEMNTLLTKMRRLNIPPDLYTYNTLLKICADSSTSWKEGLSLLSQCQREPSVTPDIITYTTAMRGCARGRQAKKALELFHAAQDLGLQLDVYIYTIAMDACVKEGGEKWREDALLLFDEMSKSGIEPSEVTYGVAIAACGNDWERALDLIDQMRYNNMRINTIVYNSAIAALSRAARAGSSRQQQQQHQHKLQKQQQHPTLMDVLWEKTLHLMKCMEDEDVRRDSFTYSSAIGTCGAVGQWEEAVNLIQTMKTDDARPNRVAYTSAISACARASQWDSANELFNLMKSDGFQPDLVSYNALIGAGMNSNKHVEVYNLWHEMCQMNDSENVSPDIVTLTEVIATLDKAPGEANRERVDKIFSEAVSRGLVLREDSLDTLFEVDLSSMSLPVARAACRFIFRQVVEKSRSEESDINDLSLITGPSRLREYVREVLRDELKPPVYCTVPTSGKGTLVIKRQVMTNYLRGQII